MFINFDRKNEIKYILKLGAKIIWKQNWSSNTKVKKSKNMSQEKLAEKLGVSRHSISNWEREVSNPDLKQF